MLRVSFRPEDLLRIRFAPVPAPMIELGIALAVLQQRRDVLFDRWRRHAGTALPSVARSLFELIPSTATGPLFLDPLSDGFVDGLDTVLSSPTSFVSSEMQRVFGAGKPVSPWARALEEHDAEAWATLGAALRTAYDVLLEPEWSRVQACYSAEVGLRGRLWAHDGLAAVLCSIHPGSRWNNLTLEIPVESQLNIDLGGHGVTLLPSVLWRGRPMFAEHPDGSTVIVYPAATPLPISGGDLSNSTLAALMGPSRAAVLALSAATRTTTELATEAGISVTSASQHAKILRAAGLTTATRDGKAVLHTTTSLGDQVLASGEPSGRADKAAALTTREKSV